MSKDNAGGGAFPRNVEGHYFMGMTLRDYFAAKAMQALIEIYEPIGNEGTIPDVASDAYTYADAMLKARNG